MSDLTPELIKRIGHQTVLAYHELERKKIVKLRRCDYEAIIDVNNDTITFLQRQQEISNELKAQVAALEAEKEHYKTALINLAKSPQGFTGYWKDYAFAALKDGS